MPALTITRSANASVVHSYRPVAIFLGGTAGIGEGLARAFAQHTHGDADIFIVGRNRVAGEAILSSLPMPTGVPKPRREFISCDATLMRNVKAAAYQIKLTIDRVNFLVLTPGVLSFRGRDETDEGIDKKLALHYYSRWACINELSSPLQNAKRSGQDAKVMTVLSAGTGSRIDTNDLGLKKNFSLVAAARTAPTYNDCMVEPFAERYPDVSFIHAHPGVVKTEATANSPSLVLRMLAPIARLILSFKGDAAEDHAEYLLHALYTARPGAAYVDPHGDDLRDRAVPYSTQEREALWDHTEAETQPTKHELIYDFQIHNTTRLAGVQ